MATQVQNRRGSTAEHSTFTGAVGELTVDTTKDTVVVHDGAVAGGRPLLREDQSNLPTSAPTTGLYNASGALALSTNGTGRLFVNASGRVGVGGAPLIRDFEIQNTGTTAFARIRSGTPSSNTSTSTLEFLSTFSGSGVLGTAQISASTPAGGQSELYFSTSPSGNSPQERLRITSAGLVGIGTSAPAETLDVNGNLVFGASFAGRIRTKNAGGGSAAGTIEISAPNETTTRGVSFGNNYYITASNTYAQTATNIGGSAVEFRANNANYGEILFRQKQDPDFGGAERTPLVIDSSGRVGIGTTSPTANLELGAVASANQSLRINSSGNNYIELSTNGSTGEHKITAGNSASGTAQLVFETSSGGVESERARIDSSGRLLVGTSSSVSGALLQVQGDSRLAGALYGQKYYKQAIAATSATTVTITFTISTSGAAAWALFFTLNVSGNFNTANRRGNASYRFAVANHGTGDDIATVLAPTGNLSVTNVQVVSRSATSLVISFNKPSDSPYGVNVDGTTMNLDTGTVNVTGIDFVSS